MREAHHLVHTVKGAAGHLAALELYAHAEKLEHALLEPHSKGLADLVNYFEAAFNEAVGAAERLASTRRARG